MAIELWKRRPMSPFRELGRMEREMEDTFNRYFRGWPLLHGEAEPLGREPALDVINRKDEVVLRADLPGLTEKDIQITVQDGRLLIQGERKEEKETKEEDYYACERWYGSFSRTLTLPVGVNAENINATFKNGVLEVHLPKTKVAEGKKIEVKAA